MSWDPGGLEPLQEEEETRAPSLSTGSTQNRAAPCQPHESSRQDEASRALGSDSRPPRPWEMGGAGSAARSAPLSWPPERTKPTFKQPDKGLGVRMVTEAVFVTQTQKGNASCSCRGKLFL